MKKNKKKDAKNPLEELEKIYIKDSISNEEKEVIEEQKEEESEKINLSRTGEELKTGKSFDLKKTIAFIGILIFAFGIFYTVIKMQFSGGGNEKIEAVDGASAPLQRNEKGRDFNLDDVKSKYSSLADMKNKVEAEKEEAEKTVEDNKDEGKKPKANIVDNENALKMRQIIERKMDGEPHIKGINSADKEESKEQTPLSYHRERNRYLDGQNFADGRVDTLEDRDYLLSSGTSLSCVLKTKIVTGNEAVVLCQISQDVYSDNGYNLLIRKGALVEGSQQQIMAQGQPRVFVTWRSIRDGDLVATIDSLGVDNLGASGLPAWIDTQFWKRFGNSLLLSFIDDALAVGVSHATKNVDAETVNMDNYRSTATNMAEIALENSINIPPIAYINQGEKIKILVPRNIDFRPVKSLLKR